jgi:hypothetical protein
MTGLSEQTQSRSSRHPRLVGLSFDQAEYIHSLIVPDEPDSRIPAANWLIQDFLGEKIKECSNAATATEILRAIRRIELEAGNYLIAATMSWGTMLFDSRPKSVRLIWAALQKHPRLLVFGAGAMGKSYTVIAFKLLDWERDPEFTTIKLASTTAGHERANTFSNLVRLHRMSAIPFSGEIKQGFIGLDKDDKRSSIAEVTIDKGDENKSGKLQGFHSLPRPYPHPTFGWLTRVSGVFDEVEDIALGLWKGEANMMLNMDDEMHVSMVAMWNPKDKTSMAAKKSEPPGGWINLDESIDEYTSKEGYHCIRLDARKCENVIERRTIFHGLQTFEGYKLLEEKGGADLQTFGYGVYPLEIAAFGIIDPVLLERSRGTFIWSRTPTPFATLDMAEEGRDEAFFTAYRYGRAIAFEPEGKDRIIFDSPRFCIQVDQQFPLAKKNTILMGKDAIDMCVMLHVKPEWFALDCSNSVTLRDWLRLKWGNVLGIKWGAAPSEIPILHEIKENPIELYSNAKTEMWFACGSWVEFGYMAFAPSMDTAELFDQLSDFRYKPLTKLKKQCEETREYKKRHGGQSPDRAASCVMGPQLVRLRTSQVQRPAMEPGMRREGEALGQETYDSADITFEEESQVSDEVPWLV